MINISTWIFYKSSFPMVSYFYYGFYVIFGLFIISVYLLCLSILDILL